MTANTPSKNKQTIRNTLFTFIPPGKYKRGPDAISKPAHDKQQEFRKYFPSISDVLLLALPESDHGRFLKSLSRGPPTRDSPST